MARSGTEHEWLSFVRVLDYIRDKYQLEFTRQTVYNWAKQGKNGIILRTECWHGQWVTRKEWIDDFVSSSM